MRDMILRNLLSKWTVPPLPQSSCCFMSHTHTLQLWFDLGLKGEGNGSITRELKRKTKGLKGFVRTMCVL